MLTAVENYKSLIKSEAFSRATRFEEVVAGIERTLAEPDERARVECGVVGEMDGAAERVFEAKASAAE